MTVKSYNNVASNVQFGDQDIGYHLSHRSRRLVSSMTEFRALSSSTYQAVAVQGFNSFGDGATGDFYLDPTDLTGVDDGYNIIVSTDGGRYHRMSKMLIAPEMFGAIGNGVADDTASFQAMAAVIRANGGAHIVLSKQYLVFNTIGSIGQVLMNLTGCRGIIVEYINNASITATYPNAANVGTSWIYQLDNVIGFNAKNPVLLANSNIPTVSGCVHFGVNVALSAAAPQTKNILIENVYQVGGLGGLLVYANTVTPSAERARGFCMTGYFNGTFYPANFQGGGDDFCGKYITYNCGRSYFPYNVSGHRVYVDSNNGTAFDDIDISCYTNPNWRNETSDIQVWYKNYGGASLGNASCLNFIQWDSTARTNFLMHDIKIHFDMNTSSYTGCLFAVNKYLNAGGPGQPGGPDNNPRSYNLFNVEISGTVSTSGNTQNLIQVCSQANWTGEIIYHFGFKNFILNGTNTVNFAVDGRGFSQSAQPGLYFENVYTSIPSAFTDMQIYTVYHKNVTLNGAKVDGATSISVSGTGATWAINYIAAGLAQFICNGVVSVPTGAGLTVTMPSADLRAGNPQVFCTPKGTQCTFQVTPISASQFTITHNNAAAVNFDLMVLMAV